MAYINKARICDLLKNQKLPIAADFYRNDTPQTSCSGKAVEDFKNWI
jgi:hypothetical protein